MRYHFSRFFFDAGANDGAAGGDGNQQQQQGDGGQQSGAQQDGIDWKAKFAEVEAKLAALATQTQQQSNQNNDSEKDKGKEDKIPSWAKTLVEQNEKLATQLTTLQAERTQITRKALFETELKAIEGLPDYYRNEVLEGFEGRSFATDADFEAFKKNKIESAKKVAENLSASQMSVFSAPKTNTGGGNANKPSSAMVEFLKSKQPQSKN